MCILIVKPHNKNVTKGTLKTCFNSNRDGAGFAYVNVDHRGHKKLKVKKAMTFNKFWRQYKRALSTSPESNFIIHFRIRTSGTIEEFNNHPFRIGNNMVIGHNGMINKMDKRLEGDENDTRAFCRIILKNLPKGWEDNKGIKEMVESYIGWSKLATLNINNKVTIFNEGKGEWDDGVWYSNSSYKPYVQPAKNYDRNYYRGKVWLKDEKKFVDEKEAVWCTSLGGYIRLVTSRQPALPEKTKVFGGNTRTKGGEKDDDKIIDIGNFLNTDGKSADDNVSIFDSLCCEYCYTTKDSLSYKKYKVDGFSFIVCKPCATILESDNVLNPHHLVAEVL